MSSWVYKLIYFLAETPLISIVIMAIIFFIFKLKLLALTLIVFNLFAKLIYNDEVRAKVIFDWILNKPHRTDSLTAEFGISFNDKLLNEFANKLLEIEVWILPDDVKRKAYDTILEYFNFKDHTERTAYFSSVLIPLLRTLEDLVKKEQDERKMKVQAKGQCMLKTIQKVYEESKGVNHD